MNTPNEEDVRLSHSDLHVRTLRVATGTHFLSFVTGSAASGPALGEKLERVPLSADLVINVDGLDSDGARAVAAVLRESDRACESRGRIIEQVSIRRLLRLAGLDRQVPIEHSLDTVFDYVLGRAWPGKIRFTRGSPFGHVLGRRLTRNRSIMRPSGLSVTYFEPAD